MQIANSTTAAPERWHRLICLQQAFFRKRLATMLETKYRNNGGKQLWLLET